MLQFERKLKAKKLVGMAEEDLREYTYSEEDLEFIDQVARQVTMREMMR
jgi:hypothetical protein